MLEKPPDLSGKYIHRYICNARALCELVKSKPELYDKNHKDYLNNYKNNETWEKLAQHLGVNVQRFKARWQEIRRKYIIFLKDSPNSIPQDNILTYLMNDIIFLKKHLSDTDINMEIELNEQNQNEAQPKFFNDDIAITTVLNDNLKDTVAESNCFTEDETSLSSQFDHLINSITTFFEYETQQLDRSSDDLFFQSVEIDYKELSDKKKRKFKLTALNILNELLDEIE